MPTIGPVQVEADSEDGGIRGVSGSWENGGAWGSGLLMGSDGSGDLYTYHAGVAFRNIQIPADAVIHSCLLEVYYADESAGSPDLTVVCGDYADAPAWGGSAVTPTTINTTTANVQWGGTTSGTWTTVPDLKDSLQEAVNNNGGIDGRLSIAFTSNLNSGRNFTKYRDFGQNPSQAARITIEYTLPGEGPGVELYKPSWPIELLHRAAWRKPEEAFTLGIFESRILSSRMIRGVK